MLATQTKAQMMSFLLETKKGGLIVVDGGWWDDADYTKEDQKTGAAVSSSCMVSDPTPTPTMWERS